MSLNSPVFIFLILPIFLGIYHLLRKWIPWGVLFLFSLLYYIWLEPVYFPLIFLLVAGTYAAGRFLLRKPNKVLLGISVGMNIGVLAFFKSVDAGLLAMPIHIAKVNLDHFPVGLSFLTFTAVAFLIDSFSQRIQELPGLMRFGVSQLFFSKTIAGPIIRVPKFQKNHPGAVTLPQVADGARRFMQGFIKKVLIADVLGAAADPIFALNAGERSMLLAWVGLFFYALQIFFDFSGYTDMALGVAGMFGIVLPENFNDPYLAKGIGEFWRRWHITLSNWFRDYVFFPLERKRRGIQVWSQHFNVLIVFLLTGLWHGFTINFVIWGLIHGFAIVFENSKPGTLWRQKAPALLQHVYALAVIIGSWVFFRTETWTEARKYFLSLISVQRFSLDVPVSMIEPIQPFTWMIFGLAVLLCLPLAKILPQKFHLTFSGEGWRAVVFRTIYDLVLLAGFIFSVGVQMEQTFVTFLYGNF